MTQVREMTAADGPHVEAIFAAGIAGAPPESEMRPPHER